MFKNRGQRYRTVGVGARYPFWVALGLALAAALAAIAGAA